jgi:hypothetical protein
MGADYNNPQIIGLCVGKGTPGRTGIFSLGAKRSIINPRINGMIISKVNYNFIRKVLELRFRSRNSPAHLMATAKLSGTRSGRRYTFLE